MLLGLKDTKALERICLSKTYDIAGKKITFESGQLALFATGSVVIRDEQGNFLLTTCGVGSPRDGDFFPLTVEYQEKYYANGKIGGNRFMKREGRPSENAIIYSRIIDRPIRPMFPKGTRSDVQIISTIMSSSGDSEFGWYGVSGASLAILLAGIKEFEAPVSAVRIGVDTAGNCFFDPNFLETKEALLDLTIGGTADAITLVESQGKEVSNEIMLKAFAFGHAIIKELCAAQEDFLQFYQQTYPLPDTKITVISSDEDTIEKVCNNITDADIEKLYGLGKMEFHDAFDTLVEEIAEKIGYEPESDAPKMADIADGVKKMVKSHMRKTVLEKKVRLDGRALTEVRPVRATAGILARSHGSALFERGVTQVLSVATLGGPGDIQIIDGMYEEEDKRYIHHYNFPPFCVGEVRPMRGVSRREIGHGRLAEKALEPVLPSEKDFPYMMRVVSETTTCNGSSSMASVCGSSLALMDAGVPISSPVAGVAIGMIYDEATHAYEILSDIQAQEDFLGDLDFKIARTQKGITALQMDCKIAGLSSKVIADVLERSVESVGYILDEMNQCLAAPRKELSPYAPILASIFIPQDKMRDVIGKGGEMIQSIEKDFCVEVNLADDGNCTITAKTQACGKQALEAIARIIKEIEVGEIYEGKIVKILDTVGAIVELVKGKEGMIHISKFGTGERIANVNDVVKVGEQVKVKVVNIDKEKGRIGLERIV